MYAAILAVYRMQGIHTAFHLFAGITVYHSIFKEALERELKKIGECPKLFKRTLLLLGARESKGLI